MYVEVADLEASSSPFAKLRQPDLLDEASSLVGSRPSGAILCPPFLAPTSLPTMAPKRQLPVPDAGPVVKKRRGPRVIPPAEYSEIWSDVYLSGTEWDQLSTVHDHDWDFSHLDDALDSGPLSAAAAPGTLVHLFGCTEPQLVPLSANDATGSLVVVPVIIAVLSARPPPATVGIKSVQRAEEEIAPMASLRMDWHARPADNAGRGAPKPRVFVLKCSERRARLRNMDEAAVHKYDYVLPWVLRPDAPREDPETNVQVLVDDLEGRDNRAPVMLNFDYAVETVDDAVEEAVEDNELEAGKHGKRVREAIVAAEEAQKKKVAAEEAAYQKLVDAISSEDRESLRGMKVFKFYPSNEDEDSKYPDVSAIKAKYINRYYGQATEIF